MGGAEADERRKYHRIATDQVISFAEIDHDDQLALSKNLSTGGIRFEAVGIRSPRRSGSSSTRSIPTPSVCWKRPSLPSSSRCPSIETGRPTIRVA